MIVERLPGLFLRGLHLAWVVIVVACGSDQSHSEKLDLPPPPGQRLVLEAHECTDRLATAASARRYERRAHLRLARYPYDPGDGVVGAVLLLEASRCFERAGYPIEAARAASSAALLVTRLRSDYSAAHVALEHALVARNWSDALRHGRRLLALAKHGNDGPYAEWVSGVVSRVFSYVETAR